MNQQFVDQDARIAQRAAQIAGAQALDSLQREDAAARERAAQVDRGRRQDLATSANQARQILAEVAPAYTARAAAAEQLAEAVREFWRAELAIRAAEGQAASLVWPAAYQAGQIPGDVLAQARAAAGLPAEHWMIGLDVDASEAGQLAGTVARGLAIGVIAPGTIALEGRSISIRLEDGRA